MVPRIPRGQLLTELRSETDLSTAEFLGHLARLVPLFVKKQVRHKVVDIPSHRTIRYYQQTGVIDPCSGPSRLATYSYRHILQVLVAKLLQSQNLTLRKIVEVTRTSRNESLERVLLSTGDSFDVVTPSSSSLVPADVAALPAKAGVGRRDLAGESLWRKFEVAKGLELHVEESFEGADHFGIISGTVLDILARLALGEEMSRERSDHPMIASGSDSSPGPIIALVTEGGLVPLGNPDHLEPLRARRFLKYRIAGMNNLAAGRYESVDRGWDNQHVNADPNRLLPVDVMAEMEQSELMFRVYDYFYTTTGVATTVEECQELAESIAGELRAQDVSAVIFTSTWGTGTRCGAVVANELEKVGLPTALVTALTPTAMMMGVRRIIPGVSITHPLGNPDLSAKKEKELRRKIVTKAIESLKAKVDEPTVFYWKQ